MFDAGGAVAFALDLADLCGETRIRLPIVFVPNAPVRNQSALLNGQTAHWREGLLSKGEHEFAFEFGLPVFATRQMGHSSVHDALAQFVGAPVWRAHGFVAPPVRWAQTAQMLRPHVGRQIYWACS